jgi:hypothetical protein
VKVESSVDIFRVLLFVSFSLTLCVFASLTLSLSLFHFPDLCKLLLIQTERTIHYKSLFYNEKAFSISRQPSSKRHIQQQKKVYFLSFLYFHYSFCIEGGKAERKFESKRRGWVEWKTIPKELLPTTTIAKKKKTRERERAREQKTTPT